MPTLSTTQTAFDENAKPYRFWRLFGTCLSANGKQLNQLLHYIIVFGF